MPKSKSIELTKGLGLVLLYAVASWVFILLGAAPLSYLTGSIVAVMMMVISLRPQWLQDLVKDIPILCVLLCDKEDKDKEKEL